MTGDRDPSGATGWDRGVVRCETSNGLEPERHRNPTGVDTYGVGL